MEVTFEDFVKCLNFNNKCMLEYEKVLRKAKKERLGLRMDKPLTEAVLRLNKVPGIDYENRKVIDFKAMMDGIAKINGKTATIENAPL